MHIKKTRHINGTYLGLGERERSSAADSTSRTKILMLSPKAYTRRVLATKDHEAKIMQSLRLFLLSAAATTATTATKVTANKDNGDGTRGGSAINNKKQFRRRRIATMVIFGVGIAIGLYNVQRILQQYDQDSAWRIQIMERSNNNDSNEFLPAGTKPKVVAAAAAATAAAVTAPVESPPRELAIPNNKLSLTTTTNTTTKTTTTTTKIANATNAKLVDVRRLEFVHIPKTGGTAIEYAASLANITWGLCHWKARPLAGPGCHHPDWNKRYTFHQSLARHQVEPSWELWHTPPSWLLLNESPYQNKTLFAIVRNPYERFISEYYCPYNGWNPVDWTQHNLDVDDPMGTLPSEALAAAAAAAQQNKKQTKMDSNYPKQKPETPESLNQFLMERLRYRVKWTAHYVPQYEYIYKNEHGKTNNNRLVQHVLKYENLAMEFKTLMEQYHYPIVLNSTINQRQNNNNDNDDLTTRMTIHDLFPETIRRINQVAQLDFEAFGYTMLNPDTVMRQRRRQNQVQRIYYINLWHKADRRELMESWLSQQPIPYQRINATIGKLSGDVCVLPKSNPLRCRGISGLILTELDIIRNHNTSGLTIVLEDDFVATQPLQKVVDATLRLVPSDWDVIRWDCWGIIPKSFDLLHPGDNNNPKVFRTVHRRTCQSGPNDAIEPCWFAGGTHAMMWREESVSKLDQIWSQKPYNDIDHQLTSEVVKSYCVNNIGIGKLDEVAASDSSSIPKIAVEQ